MEDDSVGQPLMSAPAGEINLITHENLTEVIAKIIHGVSLAPNPGLVKPA